MYGGVKEHNEISWHIRDNLMNLLTPGENS